ncbi:MAG: serine protease, partial [Candidatus Electrothrix sp. AR3]|nr:serine protease [Candidatus Electrothrix sp. AR3]
SLVQKKHKYFSGYILGNGIIITCRHGFASAEGTYDNQRPVLVRITSQDSKEFDHEIFFQATTLQDLASEGIILFESDDYDVVLLQCEQAIATFETLLFDKLEEGDVWEGGGYPYYNRKNRDTEGLEIFSGTFEGAVSKGKHLQLNVKTELPCMEDWCEASGSPIFIQGKLAGILRRYVKYDSKEKKRIIPNRLTAVYLERLWNTDKKFQRILNNLNNRYCTKSEKVLGLAEQIVKERVKLKEALDSKAEPKQVVRELVKQNLPDFLQYLEQLEAAQKDKRTLALTLLPWYFVNQSVVIDQSAKGAIDIDCISDVAAECSMAALDCRKAYLDASRSPQKP